MSREQPTILDAIAWADDAGLTASEHRVLTCFLRSEGQDGPWISWVPVEEIAWRTDYDPKTIRTAIDRLSNERGILSCIAEATKTLAARYAIHHGVLRRLAEERRAARKADTEARRRGRPTKMRGSHSPSISENEGEPFPLNSSGTAKMRGNDSVNEGEPFPKWGGIIPPEKPTEKPTEKPLDLGHAPRAAEGVEQATPTPSKPTRLTAQWRPSSIDRAFAADLGLDADALADEFRDYWIAVPGAKGTKLDWPATWRNHCRRQASRQAGRSPPRQSAMPLTAEPPPKGSLPAEPVAWSALSADEAAVAADMLAAMGRPDQDALFGGWVLQAARDLVAEGIPPDLLRDTAGAFARSRSGRDMLAEEAAADADALGAIGRRLYRWMAKVARAKRDEQPPPSNLVPLRRAQGAD